MNRAIFMDIHGTKLNTIFSNKDFKQNSAFIMNSKKSKSLIMIHELIRNKL